MIVDNAASSHWKSFSKNISAKSLGNSFRLSGYGFGESERPRLLNRLFGWISIFLHLRNLSDHTISRHLKSSKEIVKKMAPIVQSGSSLSKASYMPILENLHDASSIN